MVFIWIPFFAGPFIELNALPLLDDMGSFMGSSMKIRVATKGDLLAGGIGQGTKSAVRLLGVSIVEGPDPGDIVAAECRLDLMAEGIGAGVAFKTALCHSSNQSAGTFR